MAIRKPRRKPRLLPRPPVRPVVPMARPEARRRVKGKGPPSVADAEKRLIAIRRRFNDFTPLTEAQLAEIPVLEKILRGAGRPIPRRLRRKKK